MKTSIELIVEELTHNELKERFLELHANYEKNKDELFELKQSCVIKQRELLIAFLDEFIKQWNHGIESNNNIIFKAFKLKSNL